jgi:hypothetical protein
MTARGAPPLLMNLLQRLSNWAASFKPGELDFGYIVAVLIIIIGLVPFASVGLWLSP